MNLKKGFLTVLSLSALLFAINGECSPSNGDSSRTAMRSQKIANVFKGDLDKRNEHNYRRGMQRWDAARRAGVAPAGSISVKSIKAGKPEGPGSSYNRMRAFDRIHGSLMGDHN